MTVASPWSSPRAVVVDRIAQDSSLVRRRVAGTTAEDDSRMSTTSKDSTRIPRSRCGRDDCRWRVDVHVH